MKRKRKKRETHKLFSRRHRSLLLAVIIMMGVGGLGGCNNGTQNKDSADQPPTHLIYYTIGNPDSDIAVVTDEINRILREEINVTIEYNKIAWADYGTRIASMISSGSRFDVAFASNADQGDFIGNAQKNAWLPLDSYFETAGKEMYEAINPLYWEGVKVNQHVYGVPTNKEIAVPLMFMYPQSLIDKYQIDVRNYKTIQSVEPLLKMIHENEPDYLGLELDSTAHNYFSIYGYEYLVQRELPLMVKSADKKLEIVNIFETDACKDILSSIRRYYKADYINVDAPVKESGGLEPDKKVFMKIAEGGPYSDVLWSNDRQYKVVTQQVSNLVVTTESTQGGIMVVNAKSEHPQESVEFLNCLNTNANLRNLFNFGIEGKHYLLTENNQVNKISNTYAGVQYTQGNWFLLKTVVGEPLDKWNQFQIFNNSAYRSEALGFIPDLRQVKDEVAAVQNVWRKYYACLMTGSVDVDVFLPLFVKELKEAGIDRVKKHLQEQLTDWKRYQA